MRSITRHWKILLIGAAAAVALAGCRRDRYGVEQPTVYPGDTGVVWAIAPAVNLSGVEDVDPILQADLLYQQVQQVKGITAIPVNRVAEVYASLRLRQVQSVDQATIVCDLLGADALVVPTVTAYDPYDPPKMGASIQVFAKPGHYRRPELVDPRALSRSATPGKTESIPTEPTFDQAVGMFDAANGSVRQKLFAYAKGRADPKGPLGQKEYLVHMDRYSGFVWHELVTQVIGVSTPDAGGDTATAGSQPSSTDATTAVGSVNYGTTDR
jgi:hypothetical protein